MTMMTCFATLIFALTFIATNVNAIVGESEFCWKKGKPRGAGRIPKACAPGYQRIGLLCYEDCDEGYIRVPGSVDCIQQCPKNEPGKPTWRNDGAYCRLAEYNRGGIAPKDTIGGGCSSDKVLSAGLCYKPCKDGYARGATRCWAKCFHEGHELYNRENYRNDGAYCYKRRGAKGCPPNTRNRGVTCKSATAQRINKLTKIETKHITQKHVSKLSFFVFVFIVLIFFSVLCCRAGKSRTRRAPV